MVDVQRSALGESGESLNVELQANGRRKIQLLHVEGWTHDLRTSCNGSDMELTMHYKLRL